MDSSTKALLSLWLIPGLGPRKIDNLLKCFESAEKVFSQRAEQLESVNGISSSLAQSILNAPGDPRVEKEIEMAEQLGVQITGLSSDTYPDQLKQIHTAPPVLYSKGNHDLKSGIPVAFVGSRKASFSGKNFCRRLIQELAEFSTDFVIISGLALGIDTIAHQTALDCGLKTIAVLAGGLSNIYPPQNRNLSQAIQENGTLITEFPIASRPAAQNFPLRNRLISGLSKGIIVVEAGEKSGALITAGYAIEQNRELFAAPGPVDSVYYRGTNRLIQRSHAKLILDASDIIEEFCPDLQGHQEQQKRSAPVENLSMEEMSIHHLLEQKAQTVDELSSALNIPIPKLKSLLTMMELKGQIIGLSGSQYAIQK